MGLVGETVVSTPSDKGKAEPPWKKGNQIPSRLRSILLLCIGGTVLSNYRHVQRVLHDSSSIRNRSASAMMAADAPLSRGHSSRVQSENAASMSLLNESNMSKPSNLSNRSSQPSNRQPNKVITKSDHYKLGRDRNHSLAGLSCANYGGPPDLMARSEMMYWRDIPSDAAVLSQFASPPTKGCSINIDTYTDTDTDITLSTNITNGTPSPFSPSTPSAPSTNSNSNSTLNKHDGIGCDYADVKYLTFEPDEAGWNNIRMGMETAVTLAIAMGRTLVLPPKIGMFMLNKDPDASKNKFTFSDFYHFGSIAKEYSGFNVITFQQFLQREMLTGNLRNKVTGKPSFTPNNQTMYLPKRRRSLGWPLWKWLRSVAETPIWKFDKCVVYFPEKPGREGEVRAVQYLDDIMKETKWVKKRIREYRGKPTPVNGTTKQRLREILGFRKNICVYNQTYQDTKVLHFMGDHHSGSRLLVHFYAYLFFENWKQDLWIKRFVRDHLRYLDIIQCTAARVVQAMREKAREHGQSNGAFDSFHVRRGDFQFLYNSTQISAEQIYQNTKELLLPNATLFIATDERQKDFFDPLRQHYHLHFLDDFEPLLDGVSVNYYGMLDQLIASKGRRFFGAFPSTFTGYITRMRGYHDLKNKAVDHELGRSQSFYYTKKAHLHLMRQYQAISGPMWAREFPTAWRLLDFDVDEEDMS